MLTVFHSSHHRVRNPQAQVQRLVHHASRGNPSVLLFLLRRMRLPDSKCAGRDKGPWSVVRDCFPRYFPGNGRRLNEAEWAVLRKNKFRFAPAAQRNAERTSSKCESRFTIRRFIHMKQRATRPVCRRGGQFTGNKKIISRAFIRGTRYPLRLIPVNEHGAARPSRIEIFEI